MGKDTAEAIHDCLISPNENMEVANVVDGLFAIARAMDKCGRALQGIADYHHPQGGHDLDVKLVADAIDGLAGAIERKEI